MGKYGFKKSNLEQIKKSQIWLAMIIYQNYRLKEIYFKKIKAIYNRYFWRINFNDVNRKAASTFTTLLNWY